MNDENVNDRKKKKRIIPFLWFGGITLGGALIASLLVLNNKAGQIKELENTLTEKERQFNSTSDSLSSQLATANGDYEQLISNYDSVSNILADSRAANNRLIAVNAAKIEACKDENANLLLAVDQQKSANEMLNEKVNSLLFQLEDLQAQSQDLKNANSEQAKIINEKEERIAADSAHLAQQDSLIKAEDVAGFTNITELGGGIGLGDVSAPYSHHFYSISTVNGYVINKHFTSGIGIGINVYNGGIMAPLYLDFRYNFSKRKFTPFIYADGGMLLDFDDFKEPGLFINPGVGILRKVSEKLAINLSAGLFVQRAPLLKSSFINFKLGLVYTSRKKK